MLLASEMDLIDIGLGLKLTTEAQRPRRKEVFPGRETAAREKNRRLRRKNAST
jgi:hypothetical protein